MVTLYLGTPLKSIGDVAKLNLTTSPINKNKLFLSMVVGIMINV